MVKKLFCLVALMGLWGVLSVQAEVGSNPPATMGSGQEASTANETAPLSTLKADIKVGTGIENYDPIGVSDSFPSSTEQLVGWTRISGAKDSTNIAHVWLFSGKEVARIELNVKSDPYRTWSRIGLRERTGTWILQVVDHEGNIVGSKEINIIP